VLGDCNPRLAGEYNHLGGSGGVALAASIGRSDLRSVSLSWCDVHNEDIVALSGAFARPGAWSTWTSPTTVVVTSALRPSLEHSGCIAAWFG
jgi:hypothetical protein